MRRGLISLQNYICYKLKKILVSFTTIQQRRSVRLRNIFFLLLSYHTEADGSYATFISPFAGFVHVALTAQSQGCIWLWPTTGVPRTLALAGSEQRVRLKSILRAGWWSAGRWFQTAKKVSMIPHDDEEEKAVNPHLIYMYIFMYNADPLYSDYIMRPRILIGDWNGFSLDDISLLI